MATKVDLVDKLTRRLKYLKDADARLAIDCVIDCMKEAMEKGGRVEIRGFGSLSIRERKYAGRDENYNTVYYRMSKNVENILNN